jgi:hypothetical protein
LEPADEVVLGRPELLDLRPASRAALISLPSKAKVQIPTLTGHLRECGREALQLLHNGFGIVADG